MTTPPGDYYQAHTERYRRSNCGRNGSPFRQFPARYLVQGEQEHDVTRHRHRSIAGLKGAGNADTCKMVHRLACVHRRAQLERAVQGCYPFYPAVSMSRT